MRGIEQAPLAPVAGIGRFSLDGPRPHYVSPVYTPGERQVDKRTILRSLFKTADTEGVPGEDGLIINCGSTYMVWEDRRGQIEFFDLSLYADVDQGMGNRILELDKSQQDITDDLRIVNAMLPLCQVTSRNLCVYLGDKGILEAALGKKGKEEFSILGDVPETEGEWRIEGRFGYRTDYRGLPFQVEVGFVPSREFLGHRDVMLVSGVKFFLDPPKAIVRTIGKLIGAGLAEETMRRVLNPYVRLVDLHSLEHKVA